jgi:hypothetical protein
MKKLEEAFREMLGSIGNDYSEDILTALYPIKGHKYNNELMVVGRALNRWGIEKDKIWWNPNEGEPKQETIDRIIDYSSQGDKPKECPLKWITDHWGIDSAGKDLVDDKSYNMKRSAFWRVIREILMKLEITTEGSNDEDWSSFIVWSDLYKIASPLGGNPSNKLLDAQYEGCKKVLKAEIECFSPTRILFLTGYNWFKDFESEEVGFKKEKKFPSLVEWVGHYDKTQVVVAKHPQGKDETEYVKQVIKYFRKQTWR